MNRLAQESVIVGMTRRLEEQGNWCGETHLQKAAYLARGIFGIDFDFDFIRYKQGPYSFGLREELGSMCADRLLERIPQTPPFGPRLLVTERGRDLESRLVRVMEKYEPRLEMLARHVADRGAVELERLAVALWLVINEPGPVARRAESLAAMKPRVTPAEAMRVVEEVDEMIAESPWDPAPARMAA